MDVILTNINSAFQIGFIRKLFHSGKKNLIHLIKTTESFDSPPIKIDSNPDVCYHLRTGRLEVPKKIGCGMEGFKKI